MTSTEWPAVYISSIAFDRQEVELVPGARNLAKCFPGYHLNSDLSGSEVSMSSEVPSSGDTRYPQLIAFDLDCTLWDLWIDTHVSGPLKRHGDELNRVVDRFGEEIRFYKDVPAILNEIHDKTTIAACSRTHTPDLARQALTLLLVPPHPASPTTQPRKAIDFFGYKEIYPGSKIAHFKALHRKTGIPYTEMLFFDDENRNREVEELGVTFVLIRRGTDWQTFNAGLEKWRKKQAKPSAESEESS